MRRRNPRRLFKARRMNRPTGARSFVALSLARPREKIPLPPPDFFHFQGLTPGHYSPKAFSSTKNFFLGGIKNR